MILPLLVIAVCFIVLFKCAHFLVDGAVALARITGVPKFIIGVVVVGFATTAPELAVSTIAAFLGHSEIALGNALGSVVCDDALALGGAALISAGPLVVTPHVLKNAALFLIAIDFLAYAFAFNGTVGRAEGFCLLAILAVYYAVLTQQEKRRRARTPEKARTSGESRLKIALLFLGGIAGVILASRGIVWAAIIIAARFGISETIIGLTVIAIGTSLPEISTCVAAGYRGEGDIAIGNIIGADILNILWITGMAAVVNPISVEKATINFAFPWMIGVVLLTLLFLRIGYSIGRVKGAVLVMLYLIYITWTIIRFY
jgi:cation:H+ antiporter